MHYFHKHVVPECVCLTHGNLLIGFRYILLSSEGFRASLFCFSTKSLCKFEQTEVFVATLDSEVNEGMYIVLAFWLSVPFCFASCIPSYEKVYDCDRKAAKVLNTNPGLVSIFVLTISFLLILSYRSLLLSDTLE